MSCWFGLANGELQPSRACVRTTTESRGRERKERRTLRICGQMTSKESGLRYREMENLTSVESKPQDIGPSREATTVSNKRARMSETEPLLPFLLAQLARVRPRGTPNVGGNFRGQSFVTALDKDVLLVTI